MKDDHLFIYCVYSLKSFIYIWVIISVCKKLFSMLLNEYILAVFLEIPSLILDSALLSLFTSFYTGWFFAFCMCTYFTLCFTHGSLSYPSLHNHLMNSYLYIYRYIYSTTLEMIIYVTDVCMIIQSFATMGRPCAS